MGQCRVDLGTLPLKTEALQLPGGLKGNWNRPGHLCTHSDHEGHTLFTSKPLKGGQRQQESLGLGLSSETAVASVCTQACTPG